MDGGQDFAATVRATLVRLIETELPAAALARGWTVRSSTAFERILLDRALGVPWETVLGPAGRGRLDPLDGALAVEIGARLLSGEADPGTLDAWSRRLRATVDPIAPQDGAEDCEADCPDALDTASRLLRDLIARRNGRA
jgi:hypothetical protein